MACLVMVSYSKEPAMKISLSPDVERLIADQVRSGRYNSADEVVREGLELLQEREKVAQRSPSNGTANFAAAFENIAKDVPDKDWDSVPADLSKNLDHYLYGGRRTS
jgi:antitoxin ParD1/3/4